ncbi:hypothetical protein [Streptomyces sp. NBC_00878]|uniref:hypothetical protein n=1 Tax=Streptomyces sp. NBC_00878 TaxID=2975854 RepID=UPI00225BEF9A|nr:hypothetical protein [Streptomyces sp. NBC_00878]MCX4909592.1 hypothetical protein [Streptomyces sp. NBC_00878]
MAELLTANHPGRDIMVRDPRIATRKWAAQHPLLTGVTVGGIFYLVEILATADLLGTLPFAILIGAIFSLTALSERRRRKKHNLPF